MKSIFVLTLLLGAQALSCTSFLKANSEKTIMTKNFDWQYGHGALMTNKRNVQKMGGHTRGSANGTDRPYLWTSKYGSLTFNQLGRELPYGGMNEKGLAIEILWLEATEYPDLVPGIQSLTPPQWVQTMLDQAATVDEVVALTKDFQVAPIFAKVHFFVCEPSGQCAVFEFLKHSLFITRLEGKKDLKALTNDPYKVALNRFKEYEGFGGERPAPGGMASFPRFVRVAEALKDPGNWTPIVKTAFDALDKVNDPKATQWSIVYDLTLKKIYFKTMKHPEIKEVALDGFDWDCHSAVKVFNLDSKQKGEVGSLFEDDSDELNKKLGEQSLFVPAELIKRLPEAAASDHCI
jgi:choloylglycine hydrolase